MCRMSAMRQGRRISGATWGNKKIASVQGGCGAYAPFVALTVFVITELVTGSQCVWPRGRGLEGRETRRGLGGAASGRNWCTVMPGGRGMH